MNNKGFTLVELLTVMSIIALLSVMSAVLISTTRRKSFIDQALGEMSSYVAGIEVTRSQKKMTLREIFSEPPNISQLCNGEVMGECQEAWNRFGVSPAPADPWDNIYALEDNEFTDASGECDMSANQDRIVSAGPNGIFNDRDDLEARLPYYTRACERAGSQ